MFVGCGSIFGGMVGGVTVWFLMIIRIIEVLSSTLLELLQDPSGAVNFQDPADIGGQKGTVGGGQLFTSEAHMLTRLRG